MSTNSVRHIQGFKTTAALLLLIAAGCTTYNPPPSQYPQGDTGAVDSEGNPLPEGTTGQAPVSEAPAPAPPPPPPRDDTTGATLALQAASRQALQAGDAGLAIAHLERAIRIEPRRSELWADLAGAYLANRDSRLARRYAEKALSLAGERGDLIRRAWLVIADVEAFEGNTREAERIRREFRSYRG